MLKTEKMVEVVLSLASLSEMQLEMGLAVCWMALWLVLESWVTGLPLCTNPYLALAPALASKGWYDHLWVVCAPGEGHHF